MAGSSTRELVASPASAPINDLRVWEQSLNRTSFVYSDSLPHPLRNSRFSSSAIGDDLTLFVEHGAETWKGVDVEFRALPELELVQRHLDPARGPNALPEAIEKAIREGIETLRYPLREAALDYFGFSEEAKGKLVTPRYKLAAGKWGMHERDIRRPKKKFGGREPREWLVEQVAHAMLELDAGPEPVNGEVAHPAVPEEMTPLEHEREHLDLFIACSTTSQLAAIASLEIASFQAEQDVMFGFEILRFQFLDPGHGGVSMRGIAAVCGESHDEMSMRTAQFLVVTQPRCVCLLTECMGAPGETVPGDLLLARAVWDKGPPVRLTEAALESDARQFEMPQQLAKVVEALAQEEGGLERPLQVGDLFTVLDGPKEAADLGEVLDFKPGTAAVDETASAVAEVALRQGIPWVVLGLIVSAGEDEAAAGIGVLKAALSEAASLSIRLGQDNLPRRRRTATGAPGPVLAEDKDLGSLESERKALQQKLHLDFANANISDAQRVASAMHEATRNLEDARLVPPGGRDPRLAPPEAVFTAQTWSGPPSAKAIREVTGLQQLMISCSAIYPAAVSVLLSIKNKYLPQLVLDVNAINSIEVVQHLEQRGDYDFLVAADDPMFLAGGEGSFKYRRVLPLLQAPQWIFHRKDDAPDGARLLILATGSSGASQFLAGRTLPRTTPEYIAAAEIRERALALEPGELIPAWEPIASELRKVPELGILPGSNYEIHVSLYSHTKKWTGSPGGTAALRSFVEVFVSEWMACSEDLGYCCNLLEADENFMWFFTQGAGG
jgi:hypothetical protein